MQSKADYANFTFPLFQIIWQEFIYIVYPRMSSALGTGLRTRRVCPVLSGSELHITGIHCLSFGMRCDLLRFFRDPEGIAMQKLLHFDTCIFTDTRSARMHYQLPQGRPWEDSGVARHEKETDLFAIAAFLQSTNTPSVFVIRFSWAKLFI